MGQYWRIVNLDKKEYLSPYDFGNLGKLMEFSVTRCGITTALVLLLADPVTNGRGGGDFHSDNIGGCIIGSWAGDRIKIVGDYGDDGIYDETDGELWENISRKILEVMETDDYIQIIRNQEYNFYNCHPNNFSKGERR